MLAYPDFYKDFTLETDASKQGLGAILSQYQDDKKLHLVAYASHSVSTAESNYAITNLETLAVVWAVRYYLYGHNVTVITDHAAVKAILGVPNPTGQHARWWSKLYGSGIKKMEIIHRAGMSNQHADALSRQPVLPAPPDSEANSEVQVAHISSSDNSKPDTISSLICKDSSPGDNHESKSFAEEQLVYSQSFSICQRMLEPQLTAKVAAQASTYTIVDDILYFNEQKGDSPRAVVPCGLQWYLVDCSKA